MIVSADPALSEKVVDAVSRGNRELVRIHTVAEGVAAVAEGKADVVIFERRESDEAGKLLAECDSADIPLLLLGSTSDLAAVGGHLYQDMASLTACRSRRARVEIFERVKRKIERLRSQALIDELTNRTFGDTWTNR